MSRTTRGEDLKQSMGFYKEQNVYISYVYKSSPSLYIIWYNSVMDRWPVTKTQLKSYSNLVMFDGAKEKYEAFSPPYPIEKFSGLGKGTFIVYDLAYAQMTKNKHKESVEKIYPVNSFYQGKLNEVTLYDLKNRDAIAPSTMQFRKERNKIMGLEKNTTKIIDVFINEAEDSITFAFITGATDKYPDDYKFKRVSPLSLDIIPNTTARYELQIKFLGYKEWLEAFEGSEITIKNMEEILKVLDVQVFSTSPSFQYQSYNYSNSQLGTSAYPTDIAPKVWNKRLGGEYFLDKHIFGVVSNMGTFLPKMAKMLSAKLVNRGLLKNARM